MAKSRFSIRYPFRRRFSGMQCGANYVLTPLGKQKAGAHSLIGNKYDVVVYLSENAPATISEVANGTRLMDNTVKQIVKELIREEYVRRASAEGFPE